MEPPPLPALFKAVVVNRNDPDRLGRVTLQIPGMIDESDWAWPLTSIFGSGDQRGVKAVPQKNAVVFAMPIQGDTLEWGYMGGPPGIPDAEDGSPGTRTTPRPGDDDEDPPVETTPEDDADVHTVAFRDYELVVDERPGKERLVIKHRASGDRLEHDGAYGEAGQTGPGWYLKGSAISIESTGAVVITAARVVINERTVSPGSGTI